MENNKSKKNDIFFRVLFVLFILFLCVYSISKNGYIEKNYENKTLLTEEQIKKFEYDVANGNSVDINEYIEKDKADYSNKASIIGEKISKAIDYTAKKSIEAFNSLFSFLFN